MCIRDSSQVTKKWLKVTLNDWIQFYFWIIKTFSIFRPFCCKRVMVCHFLHFQALRMPWLHIHIRIHIQIQICIHIRIQIHFSRHFHHALPFLCGASELFKSTQPLYLFEFRGASSLIFGLFIKTKFLFHFRLGLFEILFVNCKIWRNSTHPW